MHRQTNRGRYNCKAAADDIGPSEAAPCTARVLLLRAWQVRPRIPDALLDERRGMKYLHTHGYSRIKST